MHPSEFIEPSRSNSLLMVIDDIIVPADDAPVSPFPPRSLFVVRTVPPVEIRSPPPPCDVVVTSVFLLAVSDLGLTPRF